MSRPRCIVTALLDTTECVSVLKVQQAARINPGQDEPLIEGYIASAREMIEQLTGKAIRRKTYTASFDHAGGALPWWDGVVEMARSAVEVPEVELPWSPLVSVQQIRCYTLDDVAQVADVATYRVDTSSQDARGRVMLRSGYAWPTIGRSRNGFEVDFTAGYAVGTVPAMLMLAVQMLATHFYTNRGDCGSPEQCVSDAGCLPLIRAHTIERVTA